MSILGKISAKRFDNKIEQARKRAVELQKEKGRTVICEYCHQLMPKEEAEVVYNIEADKLEFSHTKCFEENNHIAKEGEWPVPKEE